MRETPRDWKASYVHGLEDFYIKTGHPTKAIYRVNAIAIKTPVLLLTYRKTMKNSYKRKTIKNSPNNPKLKKNTEGGIAIPDLKL